MTTDYRDALHQLMVATLVDQATHGNWDYRAVRPLPIQEVRYRRGVRIRSDCSFGIKMLCHEAGVPDDPTGGGYDGFGNSSSIAAHLPHASRASQLQRGDIVTSGSDGANGHAAMVKEPGVDPLMWSDGHQGAPNEYRLSTDTRPHLYCKLVLPHHKPTPDDRLRAKTGYWAWLQWALGEGAWKHKGRANRRLRPDVPQPVPLRWWKARARFLLQRKKGNQAAGPS